MKPLSPLQRIAVIRLCTLLCIMYFVLAMAGIFKIVIDSDNLSIGSTFGYVGLSFFMFFAAAFFSYFAFYFKMKGEGR